MIQRVCRILGVPVYDNFIGEKKYSKIVSISEDRETKGSGLKNKYMEREEFSNTKMYAFRILSEDLLAAIEVIQPE